MEETIGFLLIWITIKLFFWGCIYFTGLALVIIISFGTLKPDLLSLDWSLAVFQRSNAALKYSSGMGKNI